MNEVDLSGLNPEERALFNGLVIDLSPASEYYKRQVKIASHVKDVTEAGQGHYRLSPEILSRVIDLRRFGVGREDQAPNRLAQAIFLSARAIAIESYFRAQRANDHEWREYFEGVKAHGPVHVRAEQRHLIIPVSETGELLEEYSHPELPHLKCHIAFNTKLGSIAVGGLPGFAGIPETVTVDDTADDSSSAVVNIEHPPGFSIKIEGAPVSQMMIATFDKEGDDIASARAYTLRLLNGLLHEMKRFLGLAAKRGRPRSGIGEKAAFLLDHQHKKLAYVTSELCRRRNEPGHRHSKECRDKIRLAANQYYRSLEHEFTRSLPGKARKS